jgi:hypothetical protein
MQELINAKFKELTENGKLDEIVTQRVTQFINETVKDSLSSYGDVSKVFKEKMNTHIIEGFQKLDFIIYSKALTDLVKEELDKSVVQYALEPTREMIREFVGALDKTEWKLSEIIEKFIEEEVIPDERNEYGEIRFICEKSDYGTYHVSFDKENTAKRRYDCDYRLMIDAKDGKMYQPTIEGKKLTPTSTMYGFELFIFKLYAMGCTIIVDEENVETEWSTYE